MSTGHLPKSADDMYAIERDGLWAIPTAEVPLTSMHRGEILDEARLPIRLTAQTACFRREAGAAGRDTRGLLRVHEFDKVEFFAYCTPEQADAAFADILARAESVLQALGLTYRVLEPLHGRPRHLVGAHDRPRGLQPGRGPVARSLVGQLVPRLPGPSRQRALPHQRRDDRVGAHRQRFGARRGPGSGPRWSRPIVSPTVRCVLPDVLAPYMGEQRDDHGRRLREPRSGSRRRAPW